MEKDPIKRYEKDNYYSSHFPNAGDTIKTFECETGSYPSKGYGVDITEKMRGRESPSALPAYQKKIKITHKQLTLKL